MVAIPECGPININFAKVNGRNKPTTLRYLIGGNHLVIKSLEDGDIPSKFDFQYEIGELADRSGTIAIFINNELKHVIIPNEDEFEVKLDNDLKLERNEKCAYVDFDNGEISYTENKSSTILFRSYTDPIYEQSDLWIYTLMEAMRTSLCVPNGVYLYGNMPTLLFTHNGNRYYRIEKPKLDSFDSVETARYHISNGNDHEYGDLLIISRIASEACEDMKETAKSIGCRVYCVSTAEYTIDDGVQVSVKRVFYFIKTDADAHVANCAIPIINCSDNANIIAKVGIVYSGFSININILTNRKQYSFGYKSNYLPDILTESSVVSSDNETVRNLIRMHILEMTDDHIITLTGGE